MANKNLVWIIVAIVGVFLLMNSGLLTKTSTPTPSPTGGLCPYQPTATYATKDVFASTIVGGTAYYKVNGEPATTTASSNVDKDTVYEYLLVNNTQYYTEPKKLTAGCGVNEFNAKAWQNGSVTLSGWDNTNSQVTTSGAYNTSLGANAVANEKITFQGTAKKSALPFGGVMVVEYNSTISSVTCTGDDISSGTDFHVTPTVTKTTHTYKVFGVKSSLDDGAGTAKYINCQFKNGATAAGSNLAAYVYYTFIPSNYYLTNDGNFALDVEKYLNDDTTRTQIANTILLTTYWG